jgi:hypothetical protein
MDEMHEFAAAGSRNESTIRMLSDCGIRVGRCWPLRRGLQDLKNGIFRFRERPGTGT